MADKVTELLTQNNQLLNEILSIMMEKDWDWWYDLDDGWKKVFNNQIGKGKIIDTPSLFELKEIKNLEELDCRNNEITDLTPLVVLHKLKDLDCGSNKISDLTPLATLHDLESLSCWGNEIVDLSPLSKLDKLAKLNCCDNKIVNLTPLINSNLDWLDCYGNQVGEAEIEKFKAAKPNCGAVF